MFPSGWKSILRPIRDGYRHLFPSPDTGPTPEERRKQRELDKLKGFTYFDTFDELYSWTKDDASPFQRANTPLLPRPPLTEYDVSEHTTAPVLLVHDYAGNYHDYEASQGAGISQTLYSCEYLQFVDVFVYFSHKLVCVPPPAWTNALHRNGVKVLGTLLIEPQTRDAERLLEHQNEGFDLGSPGGFPVARRLADMAECYGFDGWLVNVERAFERGKGEVLVQFLSELKKRLREGKMLIWYDALTMSNKVDYQNALNAQNSQFAYACGSILTNYCWKDKDAWNSKAVGEQWKLSGQDIFMGIDVWAQNKSPITQPRTTYPERGGGGTNTGMAVAKLAGIGLSAGIFGPAWTFEHFPNYDRRIEEVAWDGCALPDQFECSCGDGSERHPVNADHPITKFAREYPVGSERFFYTDFDRGVWQHRVELDSVYDCEQQHQQLAAQSILPHMARTSSISNEAESGINILSQTLSELVDSWDLVISVHSSVPKEKNPTKFYERWLPLFQVRRMPGDGSLMFRVVYDLSEAFMSGEIPAFYLKFSNGKKLMVPLHFSYKNQTVEAIVLPEEDAKPENPPLMLHEIGVYLWSPVVTYPRRVVRVVELSIVPSNFDVIGASATITDIRLERYSGSQWKLCWNFADESEADALHLGVPYSQLTGPFAHFQVDMDGLAVGRAFCTEYVLADCLVEKFTVEKGVRVVVKGRGFAGGDVVDATAQLRIEA